jgi:coenzyme F420-dependent glucose-6-phosphate dehydrogenase
LANIEITANLGENDYDPQAFVDATVYAEEMGFRTAWFGDHLFPWYHSGKRSSFVWSVMAVALAKTNRIKVGPWVTVPTGARYHPAIVAQAAATLDNMYPGRLQLGVGSGEALNERPFWNGRWPKWEERMERLTEGIRLIRMMWEAKEPFKFDGKYFSSDFYFLYTKPRTKILIYASAIGKKAAHAAGLNADGLITIAPRNNAEKLKEEILPAYREGRAEVNKKGLGKVAVELGFSFRQPEEIIRTAWRTIGIMNKDSWSIPNPVAVEKAGKKVTVDDVRRNLCICKNWKDVVKLIETYRDVGVTEVSLFTSCDKKQVRAVANNVLSVF